MSGGGRPPPELECKNLKEYRKRQSFTSNPPGFKSISRPLHCKLYSNQCQFQLFSRNMMWVKSALFIFLLLVICTTGLPVGPDLSGLS